MVLTAVDPWLGGLLDSQAEMLRAWPDAAWDVIMLLHLLRSAAMPTLADALAIGLIVLVGTAAGSGLVLQLDDATLTAVGYRADGTKVTAPCEHTQEITALAIRDVCAKGRSALLVNR